MLSPTNPAYRFDPPKGGILLNAIRPQQSIPKSPSSTSYTTPSSPSSSGSASGSDDPAPKFQSNRRITFAPLPNPRAQDDVPVIVFDHTSDKLYENPEAANSSSGDDNPAVILDPTTRSPQLGAKKPSTWSHSTKKLLKPFYKPLQKSDASDGGALGLFRSSSRDSTASSVGTLNDAGTPLARRMSTGSSPFDIGRTNQDRSGLALHPVTSENGGVATGTRMLNGRVYGGSRYRTAVQKKEVEKEPEFVEWGYGGMGSNRGSGASSTYAKVQSSHTNAVAAEDDDDGSGMGWVRKRREAREREKREREEREAKEREAAGSPAEPAAAETANTAAAGDAQSANPTQDDSSTTAQSDPVSPPTDAPQHITQAVHIPFGHHHHHHAKPSPSRRSSEMASGGNTPIIKPNNDSTPTVTSIPHSTAPAVGSSLWMSATPEQAQSSEDSESDEESTEREDEAREDDDEDEEEESEDDVSGHERDRSIW